MKRLQQQLKVVHDELTHLMADAKLDALSRSKLASASNQLMKISQEIDAHANKQAQSQRDPQERRSLTKKAIAFLASWGTTLKDIVMMRCEEDGS